jgi:hypothetical protein
LCLLLCTPRLQLLLQLLQPLLVLLLCLQLGFLLFYKSQPAFEVCPALAHLITPPARLVLCNSSGSSSSCISQ